MSSEDVAFLWIAGVVVGTLVLGFILGLLNEAFLGSSRYDKGTVKHSIDTTTSGFAIIIALIGLVAIVFYFMGTY